MIEELLVRKSSKDDLTPEQERELKSWCEEADKGHFRKIAAFITGLDARQREDHLTNKFRELYKTILNLDSDHLEFFLVNKTTEYMETIIKDTAGGEMYKRIKHMPKQAYMDERFIALTLYFIIIDMAYTAQSLRYYKLYKDGLN